MMQIKLTETTGKYKHFFGLYVVSCLLESANVRLLLAMEAYSSFNQIKAMCNA
jgi:hypothetical protein